MSGYCSGMPNQPVLQYSRPSVSPAVRAMRAWCGQARERSWALRELSVYHQADVARLLEKSAQLLARSRCIQIRLLP